MQPKEDFIIIKQRTIAQTPKEEYGNKYGYTERGHLLLE